jgi:hypothetical protein
MFGLYLKLLLFGIALAPNAVKRFPVDFQKGQVASVDVIGSGKGDIDCYLIDRQTASFLAKDESSTDMCHLSVVVPETKSYQLVVWNHGEHSTTFDIGANTTGASE